MAPPLEDLGGAEQFGRLIPRYVVSGWGRGRMEIVVAELFVGDFRTAWVGVSIYPDSRAVIAGTFGHSQTAAPVSADEVRAFLRASLSAIGATPMAHSAPQAVHARVRAIFQAYNRVQEYPPGDPSGVFEFDDQVTVVAASITRGTLRQDARHWWWRPDERPPDDPPPLSPLHARLVDALAAEAAGSGNDVPNAWLPDDQTHVPPQERDWEYDLTRTRYMVSRWSVHGTWKLLVELFDLSNEQSAWATFTLDERGYNEDERWTSECSVLSLANYEPFGLELPPLSVDWMPSLDQLQEHIEHAFRRAGFRVMPESSLPVVRARVLDILRHTEVEDSATYRVSPRNLVLESNLLADAIVRNRLDDLLELWPGTDLGTAAEELRDRFGAAD